MSAGETYKFRNQGRLQWQPILIAIISLNSCGYALLYTAYEYSHVLFHYYTVFQNVCIQTIIHGTSTVCMRVQVYVQVIMML